MQLADALARVDELKAEIDQLRPLKPEVEHRIMQKFRLEWNYNSNAIEGNSLTLGETRAFLLEGLTANGKPLKDHLDIRGHNALLNFLTDFINRKEVLTEAAIREMHKILLVEPYATEARTLEGQIVKKMVKLGAYKTEPNFRTTPTGETRYYASPEDVAPKMEELIGWLRSDTEKTGTHPLIRAAAFHHRFLAIHPFDDGNGRLARILMNLLVMQAGFPPIVVRLSKRDGYISALQKADAGELEALTQHLAEELMSSEELYLKGAKGGSVEDHDDVDKEIALLKQELKEVREPIQLDESVFRQLWEDSLLPLLTRIDKKMSAFDELFTRSNVHIRMQQSASFVIVQRHELQQSAKQNFFIPNFPRHVGLTFNWEGFKKAGTNDFNYTFELDFAFRERKWNLDFKRGEFTRDRTYQALMTEDDVKNLVHSIANDCLSQIKRAVGKSP